MTGAGKDEVKMYAITVSTEECHEKCVLGTDPAAQEAVRKHAKFVWQEPNGLFQAFLYRTPEQRKTAFRHLKKHFQTAAIMLNPAYVERKFLQEGGWEK